MLAFGLTGALFAGCAAVIYGGTRTVGYFAYEPLSGAVYRGCFFYNHAYAGGSALDVARLLGFLAGAAVGLIVGLTVGRVAVSRLILRPRTPRRLGYSSGAGLLTGAGVAALLHFESRVFVAPAAGVRNDHLRSFQHSGWWPSALVVPVLGAVCGLALGLLAGNEKRPVTTTE